MDDKKLRKLGFAPDEDLATATEDNAAKRNMNETGEYKVQGCWRKGGVTLLFEQNTSAEPAGGGLTAVITHPAVCIVSGPGGRVAVNADDEELILSMADEMG